MKKKLFNVIALFSGIIFLMAVIADLNGKWTGIIKTPDGNEIQAVYNFKVDGDKLSGTAESPAGVATIDSGKVTGNTFSFQVTVDGNDYPHKGIIYDDSCGVDIDFGGGQMIHTTIVRDTAR
ncbi:MAG: glycoside hydrolase [Bacteroidota bacterium]|nr:glycoside hydrolase [Bacteroidota bacterium]MDQ6903375.1 glycoside hydrolase [Bacteroidota bacterium]